MNALRPSRLMTPHLQYFIMRSEMWWNLTKSLPPPLLFYTATVTVSSIGNIKSDMNVSYTNTALQSQKAVSAFL